MYVLYGMVIHTQVDHVEMVMTGSHITNTVTM